MSAAAVGRIPARKSFPEGRAQTRDIDQDSDITRSEQQHWSALCDFRNANNFAFPSIPTLARKCRCSVRTTQRALRGLEEKGRIGRPEGLGGGDPNKSGSLAMYHLHRDGKPCAACLASAEKRKPHRMGGAVTSVTPVSPFPVPIGPVSNRAETGVKSSSAYKEEPLKKPLNQTTASEQPKPSGVLFAVAKPSQEINQEGELPNTAENTAYTNTIRPRVPETVFASEEEKAWVLAAWRRHPKKQGDKSEAFKYLQFVYRDSENRRVFDANHPLWCKTQQWRKENYRYCPRIPAFIDSEQYFDPPTEGEESANDGYHEVPEL